TRRRQWTLYAAALLAAFLLFCLYLKWQPFLARLELPLFVLGAPLAGLLVEKLRYPAVALILALFLVNNARPVLFENWTRPLKGPRSLFATARDDNYFSDMGQWNNRASYLESVDRTAGSGCTLVGLDISENQLEYPFQALLRERNPQVRFVHTGVVNASALYAAADIPPPCAVLCPDCIANQRKIALYRELGPPIEISRFLLFLKQGAAAALHPTGAPDSGGWGLPKQRYAIRPLWRAFFKASMAAPGAPARSPLGITKIG